MRIVELTAYHARIALKKEVRHASHSRRLNDTLLVRCRLDDGTTGWGEGLPRSYVTGEDIDAAFEILAAADLGSQWGDEFADLPSAIALCDRFRLPAAPAGARDCYGNSVGCAIELAVLDAACGAFGKSLSSVTGFVGETVAIREERERVQYSTAITAMSPRKQIVNALLYRVFGFAQCKVKVGMPDQDDAASLARIRRWIGPRVDLRIDANEAWACDELENTLAALRPYGITCVEQPVPHADVERLAAVRDRIEIPIMLDESLCSLNDGQRAIEQGTCDLFNIRLSKCGGFLTSLRLAALAHRAGLGYQLGCHPGETGILSAAGRHFACSVGGIRYLEGSYDRFLVKTPLTVEDLTFGLGGRARRLSGPGLGITVRERIVDEVCVRRETHAIGATG